jgi:proteasome assembly chaperone (PAC2) family protein
MANDSTLAGMTVINTYSGMFAQGVWANSVTGARILDNSITAIQTGNGAAQGIIVYGTSSNVTVSGNTVTARRTAAPADNAWAVAVYGTGGAHAGALVTGNTLSASGSALQNRAVYLTQANILPGSSGNTAVAGSCGVGTAGIGSTVTFTNAPACGP